MEKIQRLILVLIIFCSESFLFFCNNKQQIAEQMQRQLIKSLDVKKVVHMDYLVYLPVGYNQDKIKKWPLLLFLHGAGERGNDIELVKKHGPPKIVEEKDMPFIVVSPQCPEGQWWVAEDLNLFLEKIILDYRVDTNRIYLTGLSMGGYGTWELAIRYPEKFAAIAPICGGGDTIMIERIAHIPVWVFHDAKDKVVPILRSEEMVKALKNIGGDVRFTVYPEAGHDSWTETYNNQELYEWFLKYRKSKL
jgi:predicted peptidase